MTIITREQADEAMKFLWEIRERNYEETKNMTPEEESEYTRKKVESFHRRLKEINPGDYDFPFLRKKKVSRQKHEQENYENGKNQEF